MSAGNPPAAATKFKQLTAAGNFYDRVSETLFGNDGTGSFILGPDL